ncbi:MAG: hypothetical protein OXS28_10100 [Gammaproteobacteria bacterium]|nr:hypothetical protein [Gammaproteobacteria bacterium]MDE0283953.1 hypothetical protein [Gammaproteobacteria bacterium]
MKMNENPTDRDFDPETAPDLSGDYWQEKFDKATVNQAGASNAGFLESIQADLVDHNTSIASTLLKLRLLAAKLGSDELAEWIKYEAEGYPQDADIPAYREVPVSFSGTFLGPLGMRIENAPIPPLLIKQIAGEDWVNYKIRESAAAVEDMAGEKNGIYLDLSNLIVVLRGKIYPDYNPGKIVGFISQTPLIEMSNAIRKRLLEITIEIADKIPGAEGVEPALISRAPEVTAQIFHQTIHGNVTNIQSTGTGANIRGTINKHDPESLNTGLFKVWSLGKKILTKWRS